jgi:hypothetical protein
MIRLAGCRLLVFILLAFNTAWASAVDPDADLTLIPDTVLTDSEAKTTVAEIENFRVKTFLDETIITNVRRHDLDVPRPASTVSSWENRISLDSRAEIRLYPHISLIIADRLYHFSDEDNDLFHAAIQNDLKECYLSVDSRSSLYLDAGRINFKNGVAVGFNPTDYFKKNAVRSRISDDPAVLRENRLGTLMIRGQGIWEKGALTLAAAPEVTHPSDHWYTDAGSAGLGLERTNDRTRFLAKLTLNTFSDFSPETLYFYDRERSYFGANLTKAVGDNLILYGEWSGANRPHIAYQAFEELSDSIPPQYRIPVQYIPGKTGHFRNQLAVGVSYTEKINRTTHIEYQYNEAGMTHKDWSDWFDAGSSAVGLMRQPNTRAFGTAVLGQLWGLRQWALFAQEPITQHALFIRTAWQDALIIALDLTGIASINLSDGSFFVQPLAEYHLNGNTTLSLTVNLFLGKHDSEFGSLDPMGNIQVGITYYF